jgi:hypothetical protein
MNRREFIQYGATVFGSLAASRAIAQMHHLVRAAVVIGVKNTDGLPTLHSTIPGAKKFAGFLQEEGFEVRLHTDGSASLSLAPIKADVRDLLKDGNLDQLLVYFSGHGFRKAYMGETWLLSNALNDPDEAVNLVEFVELARSCGVPNVIVISDACRSRPDSDRAERVGGSGIFGSYESNRISVIDRFFAALPGRPSFEVSIDQATLNYKSLFTEAFLNAFHRPKPGMVVEIEPGLKVIPNRKLKEYLVEETRRLALENGVLKEVDTDAEVPSEDDVYIGRARPCPDCAAAQPPQPGATISDVYSRALQKTEMVISSVSTSVTDTELENRSSQLGLEARRDALTPRVDIDFGGAPSGIAVYGATVVNVGVKPGIGDQTINGPSDTVTIALDIKDEPAASVVIQFEDGTGSVIAALRNFVAHVFVGSEGVASVSYEPLPESPAWSENEQDRSRLRSLRSLVASATKDGVFRLGGGGEERKRYAENLANQIRIMKGSDPTLGLYAAYAYSQAGLLDDARSVDSILHGDLGARCFDLALLSRQSGAAMDDPEPLEDVYPFCPLMRAGWELLRVKGVSLEPIVEEARPYLRDSLWTSFESTGIEILRPAIEQGQFR